MIKRCFDFVASGAGILVLTPLLAVVAVIIKLDSPGPVFFRQARVGRNFVNFHIFKFRTMVIDAESRGAQISSAGDPRITRLGTFLRKYKIDELPQLFNVFLGEMSLVGPRPEVPRYVEMFRGEYEEVLSVKPGITDFASLEYKDENDLLRGVADPEKVYIETILPRKLAFSRRYLKERGFMTDFLLIIRTIMSLFR